MMLIPVRKVGAAALSLLFLLFSSQLSPGQNRDIQPPPDRAAKPDDGIDVQARGPVHEAYAQPYERNPGPTAVVPKKPPAPVPEEPPDQKPKGDNVQWIPGYWAWDSDKNDFLWVSGTWRATPPDRKWTPGHWTQVDNGWQWVPGLWQAADQQDLQYLPEPPANLDNGPSTLAPDDNSFYVPGIWQYRNSDYVWRPGYWYQQYPGWVWNPATYYWTPSGYCYASGYWDYPLADRGLLFAPAYFNQPLWQTPGWFYRPSFVIGFDGLFGSLFIGRHHHHFFFGDYYDPFYARAGFWPWYSYGRHYHDPLFSYYNWRNHGDPNWYAGLRNNYWGRRNGDLARPPQTFAQQSALLAAGGARAAGVPRIVTPLNQVALNNNALTRVNAAQAAQQRTHVQQQFNAQSQQRVRSEANAGTVLRTPRVTSAPHESFYSGNANRGNGNGATQFGTLNNTMPFRERPAGNAGAGSLPRSFPGPVIRNGAPANAAAPNVAPRNFPGPVIRNGAPGNAGMPGAAPRSFQAPVIRNAAPAYTGSSHAMPTFSRPAPSFHGGGAPSMHGGGGGHGAASFQGGGGGHGGGGHGAAPAGGGHNNGKH